MSAPTSIRLDPDLKARLERLAEEDGTSLSSLIHRLLDEGARMADHPGIVFRSGPAGRRPAVAGGPDVVEVVGFLTGLDAAGDEAIVETAEWLHLPERLVRAAVGYYAEFTEEVDREIDRRAREARQVRDRWERQQQLLA